jgi:two-component system sensor histidine kinase YesM
MELANETCYLVEALSHIFRRSLEENQSVCTLAHEVDFAKEYLKIQECRYSDRIEFNLSIDKTVTHYCTVCSILQPLIENAIVHGMGNTKEIMQIDIVAYTKKNQLVIEVSDTGILTEVTELIELRDTRSEQRKGMSLYGINSRIQLQFGPKYGLEFKVNIPHGLTIFCRQPLVESKGESVE